MKRIIFILPALILLIAMPVAIATTGEANTEASAGGGGAILGGGGAILTPSDAGGGGVVFGGGGGIFGPLAIATADKDSLFYKIDRGIEKFRLSMVEGKAKARLELKFAQERVEEATILSKKGNIDATKKLVQEYETSLNSVQNTVVKTKDKGRDTEEIEAEVSAAEEILKQVKKELEKLEKVEVKPAEKQKTEKEPEEIIEEINESICYYADNGFAVYCGENQTCFNLSCVNISCYYVTNCTENNTCVAGVCVPYECYNSIECNETLGEICLHNLCLVNVTQQGNETNITNETAYNFTLVYYLTRYNFNWTPIFQNLTNDTNITELGGGGAILGGGGGIF